MNELIFRTEPMKHQRAALERSFDAPYFAYLMEQGTGKSKIVVDRAANLFLQSKIEAALVLAPNGVHANWVNEQFEEHFPANQCGIMKFIFRSGNKTIAYTEKLAKLFANDNGAFLKVLCVNTESIASSATARDVCMKFLHQHGGKVLFALDESSMIKTPSAKTTKRIQALGKMARYRVILTGTEVTQGPLDLYAQFQFLYPGSLGAPNFATFKAHYSEWRERIISRGGREQKFHELVRYKNLEQLKSRVAAISFQIRKKDCLDLPDKVYKQRVVVLGAEQRAAYNSVRTRVLAELSPGESITTPHTLTKMTRLSQVAGGFAPLDDGSVKALPNAKLAAMLSEIEEIDADAQIIIWARFVAELNAIVVALGENNCARYWGEIGKADRIDGVADFKEGKRRFMVAQQRAGGKGHTWIAGTFVIYYSNTFSWEDRSQSEDRAHRIGQTEKVTYIDLVAEDTVDQHISKALKFKKDVAEFFKGCSLQDML